MFRSERFSLINISIWHQNSVIIWNKLPFVKDMLLFSSFQHNGNLYKQAYFSVNIFNQQKPQN